MRGVRIADEVAFGMSLSRTRPSVFATSRHSRGVSGTTDKVPAKSYYHFKGVMNERQETITVI